MSRFNEVKELVASMEDDFEKFYEKGNKAAGTRVRNNMTAIKKLAQDIRSEVTEIKNSQK